VRDRHGETAWSLSGPLAGFREGDVVRIGMLAAEVVAA
jgi:hypothetical protein